MKTISLLGTIFLPGAYLASVFSMTFFNFQDAGGSYVSSQFWIYWVVTVPVTAVIVGIWVCLISFVLNIARAGLFQMLLERKVNYLAL
jgi:Mg2+ and Co2+ transporter CorA